MDPQAWGELVTSIDNLGRTEDHDDTPPAFTSPESTENERSTSPSDGPPPPMFSQLIDYFEDVEHARAKPLPVEDWHDRLSRAKDGADPTDAFKAILSIFHIMDKEWGSAVFSDPFSVPTEALADGSRYEPWRLAYGDSGLLDFYLDYWNKYYGADGTNPDILIMFANTCVEFDANRARVLAKFDLSILVNSLCIRQRATLATRVLYSICRDYEPAEEAARSHKLFAQIIKMFDNKGHPFNWELIDEVCCLLEFAIEGFDVDDMPDDAVSVLYKQLRTRKLNFDEEISLCKAIFALLAYEHFQKLLIFEDEVELLTTLLLDTYNLDFADIRRDRVTKVLELSEKQEQQMEEIRTDAAKLLWDISERPEFVDQYPPDSKLVQTFSGWLSRPQPHIQICACNILRNVASSEQRAVEFLRVLQRDSRIESLRALLRMPSSEQVCLEGLRLLKNLALPESNKYILLSEQPTLDVLLSLCSNATTKTIRSAAVGVIRLLLTGCYTNLYRLLFNIDLDLTRPSTHLTTLIALYYKDVDVTVRMEIAQVIVQIWRVAYQIAGDYDAPPPLLTDTAILQAEQQLPGESARGLAAPICAIAAPICAMITDSGNPSLVTQGWLGLSLLARSPMGAKAIYEYFRDGEKLVVFRPIIESQEVDSKDRANTIILKNTLVTHFSYKQERVRLFEILFTGLILPSIETDEDGSRAESMSQ